MNLSRRASERFRRRCSYSLRQSSGITDASVWLDIGLPSRESRGGLNALESVIALLAAQLSAEGRARFIAALRELEATAPELNARLSWSAALQRVRLLIRGDDEKLQRSDAKD